MIMSIVEKIKSLFSSSVDVTAEFFGDVEEPISSVVSKPRRVPHRIHRDRTPLTQYQYDYICQRHATWRANNFNCGKSRAEMQPVAELVAQLNASLGLNKSQRYYTRVWGGEIDREQLPKGKPCFQY